MSNYRTTKDIKASVLDACGEPTDGTSDKDARALTLISTAHQNLLAGGNEFDIDCGEDWAWAIAQRPIVLTMEAPFTNGTVTLTATSRNGTFSVIPTDAQSTPISLVGWLLKVDGVQDFYYIVEHDVGSLNFQIDQGWLDSTGTQGSWKAIKVDYDLIDDTVVVDASNNKIDFKGTGGTPLVAVLAAGIYDPPTFISTVATALQAADSGSYTGSWDAITRKFTLAHGGAAFQLLFASGANAQYAANKILGFDQLDTPANSTTLTSAYTLNAIQRLTGPATMYREQNVGFDTLSSRDAGKISFISWDALRRDFPISRMIQGTPDVAAVVQQTDDGRMRIRINQYPGVQMRVEIHYIPIGLDLQDNDNSIPLVPLSFREYLARVAEYYLMLDKSDNRAAEKKGLASMKLVALISHNRKSSKSSSNNYGRLIPRRTRVRSFIRSTDT